MAEKNASTLLSEFCVEPLFDRVLPSPVRVNITPFENC